MPAISARIIVTRDDGPACEDALARDRGEK
jgi:hypothetical protein